METRFYLKVKESTNERFLPYTAYRVYKGYDDRWYVDDENGCSHGADTMSALEELLKSEEGVDGEIIALAPDVFFFQYTGKTNDTFEKNKVYIMRLNNIDFNAENPYKNCITGVEVPLRGDNVVYRTQRAKTVFNGHDYPDVVFYVLDCIFRYISEYEMCTYIEWYKQDNEWRLHTAKQYPKAVLTDEEYNYVYNCITSLLDEYNYIWNENAICKIIKEWVENKGELISAFKSHPNYNGCFQLVFSGEKYQMNTNKNAGDYFIKWVHSRVFDGSELLVERVVNGKTRRQWDKEYNQHKPKLYPIWNGDNLEFENYELYDSVMQKSNYAYQILIFFGSEYTEESKLARAKYLVVTHAIKKYQSDRVDANFASVINANLPELRVREGQKTTKVVGKVMKYYGIDKHADYTKKFAAYCDAINVIKITRHTMLSVHPCDYLTMSFGNSWSSCHTIDKQDLRGKGGETYQGGYSSGTMSYLLDKSSFVLYTTDEKLPPDAEMWKQDKINRCMFHAMNERIVQGRCYPQSEDGNDGLYTQFRNFVQKVMSELWEIPNFWKVKRGQKMKDLIATEGTHYPDYIYFDYCNMSVFSETKIPNKCGVMEIGHDPICVECGYEHDMEGNINCCHTQLKCCPECGALVDDFNDAIEIDGEYYHNECAFYCEYHNRYEPFNESYAYVENYGDICEDAYNSGNFEYCEDCDRYFETDEMIPTASGVVCRDCLDNDYIWVERESEYYPASDCYYCSDCDEYFIEDNLSLDDNGDLLCPNCRDAAE